MLGFLLLGLAAWATRTSSGWYAYAPYRGNGNFGFASPEPLLSPDHALFVVNSSTPRLTPWQPAIAVAFLVTVAWYAIRARGAGTPFSTRRVVGTVAAGLAVLVLGALVAAMGYSSGGSWLAVSVALPLVMIGVCAAVWAYFRLGPGRKVALAVCLVSLPLAAYALAAALNPSWVDPVTAALGLSVLAWLTRSVLLGVIVAVFLLASLAFPMSTLALLVPGAVLLAGAIAVLVPARRAPGAAG